MTIAAPNDVYGPHRVESTTRTSTPSAPAASRQVFSDLSGRRSRVFRLVEVAAKATALALVTIGIVVASDRTTSGASDGFGSEGSVVEPVRIDVVSAQDVAPIVDAPVGAEAASGSPSAEQVVDEAQP